MSVLDSKAASIKQQLHVDYYMRPTAGGRPPAAC